MDASEELRRIEALLRRPSSMSKPSTSKGAPPRAERSLDPKAAPTPVAIIGIAGVFPKCSSVADFWRALADDVSLIDELGADRFDWEKSLAYNDEEVRSRCRWAGLMARPYAFDAEFFGIPAREAELMDPRQRLLLMSVYHCLEDAGYAPESLKRTRTGLFIGVEESEYGQTLYDLGIDPGLANAPSMIANRIAYHFDFAGPSEFINTLCSSGAVALHRACNALRCGEITQAVVGAANVLVRPEPFWRLAELDQLSADRTVHSFGRNADGYLRAEGAASVLLKTLPQAEKDGDAIYAVIKNSSVNFSGQGGVSMAAPNIAAHVSLIKQCYREAGVDPREIDYIEAQGMGTPVSDIAEWRAFNRALTDLAEERNVEVGVERCSVSTLKPVMGHMHAASAFGALFKVIFSLQSDTIYKIRDLTDVSTDLSVESQPCKLLRENVHWPRRRTARLAGVHSYGLGGNNAHLLIEEYDQRAGVGAPADAPTDRMHVIPFSARSPQQCRTLVERCRQLLKTTSDVCLASLAHTLQLGRDAFEHRVAFLVCSSRELIAQMESYSNGQPSERVLESTTASQADGSNSTVDLARRWVRGERVQWPSLRGESSNRKASRSRLCLPGYPFALTDYRVAHEAAAATYASEGLRLSAIDDDRSLTRPERIRRFITLFVAQALNTDEGSIDQQLELQHLGIDSIIAIRLMRSIQSEWGARLSGRELRECNSIDSLAAQIEKKIAASNSNGHDRTGEAPISSGADVELLDSLEKFKRGELDLGQIKQILN
jgi:acyl transferase domain-containing protein